MTAAAAAALLLNAMAEVDKVRPLCPATLTLVSGTEMTSEFPSADSASGADANVLCWIVPKVCLPAEGRASVTSSVALPALSLSPGDGVSRGDCDCTYV